MSVTSERQASCVLQVLLAPTAEVGAEHPVFATLSADAGLDAAVPYIVAMIARGARENSHDLPRLWRLLWAAHALIRNHTNNAAAYLSQLLPALLTMLLNNSLGPGGASIPLFGLRFVPNLLKLSCQSVALQWLVRRIPIMSTFCGNPGMMACRWV